MGGCWIVLALLVFLIIHDKNVDAVSVLLKNAYNCPNAPNPMPLPMDITILKTFPNNTQLIDLKIDVPFPVHTNTLASVKIEYNAMGKTWVQVVKIDDKKGMCNLFTMNGGEMWIDAQKEIGLTPNTCPIPKGKYHSNHFLLNLTKQKMPGVPPGNYRGAIEVREKSTNRVLLCKMFDIEDKS